MSDTVLHTLHVLTPLLFTTTLWDGSMISLILESESFPSLKFWFKFHFLFKYLLNYSFFVYQFRLFSVTPLLLFCMSFIRFIIVHLKVLSLSCHYITSFWRDRLCLIHFFFFLALQWLTEILAQSTYTANLYQMNAVSIYLFVRKEKGI